MGHTAGAPAAEMAIAVSCLVRATLVRPAAARRRAEWGRRHNRSITSHAFAVSHPINSHAFDAGSLRRRGPAWAARPHLEIPSRLAASVDEWCLARQQVGTWPGSRSAPRWSLRSRAGSEQRCREQR